MTVHIDIIDQSGTSSRYDWPKIVHACQQQVRLHVAQAWGMGNSAMIELRAAPVPGHWPVYLLGNSDVQGALGYHETDADYRPVGKIFVLTDEVVAVDRVDSADRRVGAWCDVSGSDDASQPRPPARPARDDAAACRGVAEICGTTEPRCSTCWTAILSAP
jgi:hypothetical protein